MTLSETQVEALKDYLARHPRTCSQCGHGGWKFGEIQLPIAALLPERATVEPGELFVEIVCASCGYPDAVNCYAANILGG
jgi:hypothetical protein